MKPFQLHNVLGDNRTVLFQMDVQNYSDCEVFGARGRLIAEAIPADNRGQLLVVGADSPHFVKEVNA